MKSPNNSKNELLHLLESKKIHPVTLAMLFSDRTTPLLAYPPVWKGKLMLRLLRLAEKYLGPKWEDTVN
jgi:hypothetical protein